MGSPTSAGSALVDKDADTIYVSRVWKAKEKTAVQAWGAVKSWAHKVPTAWPHDGNQHEKGGGEQLKGQYAEAGFMMLQEHATWPDGGNAVEPGITELRDMMLDGASKYSTPVSHSLRSFASITVMKTGKSSSLTTTCSPPFAMHT